MKAELPTQLHPLITLYKAHSQGGGRLRVQYRSGGASVVLWVATARKVGGRWLASQIVANGLWGDALLHSSIDWLIKVIRTRRKKSVIDILV